MRNWGGAKQVLPPPQLKKSERELYSWSSKLKIYRKLIQMISSRLPATFFSKPIFRPPQGVSPSQAANFLKIPYQNHNVEPEQIRMLAYHGFKEHFYHDSCVLQLSLCQCGAVDFVLFHEISDHVRRVSREPTVLNIPCLESFY